MSFLSNIFVINILIIGVFLLFFYQEIRKLYLHGIIIWVRIIPLFAVSVIIFLLISKLFFTYKYNYGLRHFLTLWELQLLLFITPFFLTRIINILSGIITAYLIAKLFVFFRMNHAFNLEMFLFIGSFVSLTILGDKAIWFNFNTFNKSLNRNLYKHIRQVLILMFGVCFVLFVLIALADIKNLQIWLYKIFYLRISSLLLILCLLMFLLFWIFVILNILKHLLLGILILPSCIIFIYTINITAYSFFIMFIILVNLWLSSYCDDYAL